MDGTKFDTITQRLSAAASRRGLVSGLLGGAAILTGAAVAGAKKGGKGKGKKKGHGKGKGKAHGRNKVTICHVIDDDSGELKNVPTPALKGHLKHGDARCEVGVCQTGDPSCTVVDGVATCTFAVDEGAECEVDGVAGICSAEGVCEPVEPPVEE
jgi:hypothetical protein